MSYITEKENQHFFDKKGLDFQSVMNIHSLRESAGCPITDQEAFDFVEKQEKIPNYSRWNGTSVSNTIVAIELLKEQDLTRNWKTINYGERILDGCRIYMQENNLSFSGTANSQLKQFRPVTFVSNFKPGWCIIL